MLTDLGTCCQAVKDKDRRYDGQFLTAVHVTGIDWPAFLSGQAATSGERVVPRLAGCCATRRVPGL